MRLRGALLMLMGVERIDKKEIGRGDQKKDPGRNSEGMDTSISDGLIKKWNGEVCYFTSYSFIVAMESCYNRATIWGHRIKKKERSPFGQTWRRALNLLVRATVVIIRKTSVAQSSYLHNDLTLLSENLSFININNNNNKNNKGVIIIIIGFGNERTSGDHPNYSFIKIGLNTEKSSGDLRRLAVTKTPGRNYRLTLVGKTLKRVIITIIIKTSQK